MGENSVDHLGDQLQEVGKPATPDELEQDERELERSDMVLRTQLREMCTSLIYTLTSDPSIPSERQPTELARAIRQKAIQQGHDAALRFINGHVFRYRSSAFLQATLNQLVQGIDRLDTDFCQAVAQDYDKATSSIKGIVGLPPEMVNRQIARAFARASEKHQQTKDRLMESVEQFRAWSEGLIDEAVGVVDRMPDNGSASGDSAS